MIWLELNVYLPCLYAWGWVGENVGPHAADVVVGLAVFGSVLALFLIGPRKIRAQEQRR